MCEHLLPVRGLVVFLIKKKNFILIFLLPKSKVLDKQIDKVTGATLSARAESNTRARETSWACAIGKTGYST
jgi:hypothetical protein